jgi:hypothetical protein
MSMQELKTQILALSEEEQSHLITFLRAVRESRDPAHLAQVDARLDDPSGWADLEEARRRWGIDDTTQ